MWGGFFSPLKNAGGEGRNSNYAHRRFKLGRQVPEEQACKCGCLRTGRIPQNSTKRSTIFLSGLLNKRSTQTGSSPSSTFEGKRGGGEETPCRTSPPPARTSASPFKIPAPRAASGRPRLHRKVNTKQQSRSPRKSEEKKRDFLGTYFTVTLGAILFFQLARKAVLSRLGIVAYLRISPWLRGLF